MNGTVQRVPLLLIAKFRTNKMHFVFSRIFRMENSEWNGHPFQNKFKPNDGMSLYLLSSYLHIFTLARYFFFGKCVRWSRLIFFCSSSIIVYKCDTISHFFALICGAILCLEQNAKLRARISIHHLLFLLLN